MVLPLHAWLVVSLGDPEVLADEASQGISHDTSAPQEQSTRLFENGPFERENGRSGSKMGLGWVCIFLGF